MGDGSDDDDGNGDDDDDSVTSNEDEEDSPNNLHPVCKRYKTAKAHRRTWRVIHSVVAFLNNFFMERHSLLREIHLKMRN